METDIGSGRGLRLTRWLTVSERLAALVYQRSWAASASAAVGLQRRPRLRRETVVTRGWPTGLRPLRLGFASDLHAGPTTSDSLLRHALDQLSAARFLDDTHRKHAISEAAVTRLLAELDRE